MKAQTNLPAARDKLLFTPGPLTTSLSVKQAMLHDAGSWHDEFNAKVNWVRGKILEVHHLSMAMRHATPCASVQHCAARCGSAVQ